MVRVYFYIFYTVRYLTMLIFSFIDLFEIGMLFDKKLFDVLCSNCHISSYMHKFIKVSFLEQNTVLASLVPAGTIFSGVSSAGGIQERVLFKNGYY